MINIPNHKRARLITKVRYLRNINMLNITLIAAIIIFVNYIIFPMLNISVKYTLPLGKKTIIVDKEEKPAESNINTPSPSDYTLIAENNLFHPERKIPIEKKEEQPLPKPEFVLYGTLITDDISLAYLEDLKAPISTPSRGKRQTALKEGDNMSGFTLKEIEAEKIVLVRGEEKMTVYLNDSSHPKIREISAPVTQGAPPRAASPQTPAARQPVTPPPKPKIRAPMTPAEEKVFDFFQRQKM